MSSYFIAHPHHPEIKYKTRNRVSALCFIIFIIYFCVFFCFIDVRFPDRERREERHGRRYGELHTEEKRSNEAASVCYKHYRTSKYLFEKVNWSTHNAYGINPTFPPTCHLKYSSQSRVWARRSEGFHLASPAVKIVNNSFITKIRIISF